MKENEEPSSGGFVPRFVLDIETATGQQFAELLAQFDAYRESLGTLPLLGLSNDWYEINQELAESFLLRNAKGANRRPSFSTVCYYGQQFKDGEWHRTGEPIIFTTEGILVDGQHRLWASYLTGIPFTSYIVADTPAQEFLFAFIDNGRGRSPAVALETAGFDGQSGLIAAIAKIHNNVLSGAYILYKGKKRIRRPLKMSPIQILRAVKSNDLYRLAARLTIGEYGEAIQLIGHKDVTAYVSYAILAIANEDVLDEFMGALIDGNGKLETDDPIAALRKFLDVDKKKPNGKHVVLAAIIKAFNAWRAGDKLRKADPGHQEEFPEFVEIGLK
jgi:hypothetical protein